LTVVNDPDYQSLIVGVYGTDTSGD